MELKDEGYYRDENGKLQMTSERMEQMRNIQDQIRSGQLVVENNINTTVNPDGTSQTDVVTEASGELFNGAQLSATNTTFK